MKLKSVAIFSFLSLGTHAHAAIVSGFVVVQPDKTCRIVWGTDSDNLTCKTGVLNSVNVGYIRIDVSTLNLKLPPICAFGGSATPDGTGGVELITPRLGNFSSTYVDVLFTEQKGRVPNGERQHLFVTSIEFQ